MRPIIRSLLAHTRRLLERAEDRLLCGEDGVLRRHLVIVVEPDERARMLVALDEALVEPDLGVES